MKKVIRISLIISLLSLVPQLVFSHCQVPCGIYDDEMRITMIREHITTIEKAMKQIQELSKEGDKNYNQIVRWVSNKETHAEYIQEIVNDYFLAQRIKPVRETEDAAFKIYNQRLVLLHEIIVLAMKAKQTLDLAHIESLRALVKDFEHSYFKSEG